VGGADFQPYRRLPGVSPNLADPNLNLGETKMKCNGEGSAGDRRSKSNTG
jgi:hypothetical protein